MPSGNYLSLDVGTARIGVAIARGGVRLAHPLTTIPAGDDSYHAIGQIVIQEQIDTIIVGYPRNQAGEATQQTAYSEHFARELEAHVSVPIHFQDESLTSRAAEASLKAHGRAYVKADIDALAAALILQDYLETL